MKKHAVLLFLAFFVFKTINGQGEIIHLRNPSFEGEAIPGSMGGFRLDEWEDCGMPFETPPDVHSDKGPPFFRVFTSSQNGHTFLGMVVRDNETWECVSQRLSAPLQKGVKYTFGVYLCRSSEYMSPSRLDGEMKNYNTPCRLRIWGGSGLCDRAELLAESELIDNLEWQLYNFEFSPSLDARYIVLEAFYKTPTTIPYNGNLLLDNLSPIVPIGWSEDGEFNNPVPIEFEYEEELFGEKFKLNLFAYQSAVADSLAEVVFRHGHLLEERFTKWVAAELSQLVEFAGRRKFLSVSDELWSLINFGVVMTEKTEGTFDVTAGRLAATWQNAVEKEEMPGTTELDFGKSRQGLEYLYLRERDRGVRLGQAGMQLYFGDLPKAFIADEMMKVLDAAHITRFRLDAGNITIVKGVPPETEGWQVRVFPDGGNETVLTLTEGAVVRSLARETGIEQNGKKYCDFFDPKTGLGTTNKRSVAVFGPTALLASAWAQGHRVGLSNLAQVDLKQAGYQIFVR